MAGESVEIKAVLLRGQKETCNLSRSSDPSLKSTINTLVKIQTAINEKLTEIINADGKNSNAIQSALEEDEDEDEDEETDSSEDSVSENNSNFTEPSLKRARLQHGRNSKETS